MEALTALLLVALWVAAWSNWIFSGSIRQFLFAKIFPVSWRASRSDSYIMALSAVETDTFITVESTAPPFLRGILFCPSCFSAYSAAAGAVLTLPLLGIDLIFLAPLVWAGGAWCGFKLSLKF